MFALLFLVIFTAKVAVADDGFSGYVAARSDFVRFGLSQTSGNPVLQGSLTWTSPSGVFASTFVSNIDLEPGDPVVAEVDLQVGYAGSSRGLDYSVGITHYNFPRTRREPVFKLPLADELERSATAILPEQITGGHYNFLEFFGSMAHATPLGTVSVGVTHTRNNSGDTGPATQLTLGLKRPLAEHLTADANVTYSWLSAEAGPSYADWNLGLNYDFGFVAAEVRYARAANRACDGRCDTHIVFSLIKSF